VSRMAALGRRGLVGWAMAAAVGCGSAVGLDAGSDLPHGLLPVDERNPVIVSNDGPNDNWQGEFAMLMASSGHLVLSGIIVNQSSHHPNIVDNVSGWRTMAKAARDSGMHNIPEPVASIGATLTRPDNDDIDSTEPNRSEGARVIIEAAHRLATPRRPLVIATGGALTDIADAYLMDHSITDQVVVVASIGHTSSAGIADLGGPNGNLDSWATEIVARRFRYVQINAYYAQKDDVPPSRAAELPPNPFGTWMSSKIGKIIDLPEAGDQNSVIAVALPKFALEVERGKVAGTSPTPSGDVAEVDFSSPGDVWIVPRGDNAAATARFWAGLKDTATFAH
jgi:hypothetical protein